MSSTSPQRRPVLPRFAEVAVERARLAVVPRPRARRAPRVPFLALVSVILLAGVVGLLLFNTSMQQASFTASRLEDQADELKAREEALAMELENLRDPQRLADLACRRGMVVAGAPVFLDLRTGAVTGSPSPAVPGPCAVPEPPPAKPGSQVAAASGSTGTRPAAGADSTGTSGTSGATRGSGASHAQPLRIGRYWGTDPSVRPLGRPDHPEPTETR